MLLAVWRPALLFGALVAGWAWALAPQIVPAPHLVAQTTAAHEDWGGKRATGVWCSVAAVSDDGARVTILIRSGDFRFTDSRLEEWDIGEGKDVTPALWRDPEWQEYMSPPAWGRDSGLSGLLGHPSGREFLRDADAWADLCRRVRALHDGALRDVRNNVRPVDDGEVTKLFPESAYVSPSGKCFAYVSRRGWPVYVTSDDLGDGTNIEDLPTGKRVAFLPGVKGPLRISPDGRTAVADMTLWDLESATPRAKLDAPPLEFPRLQYTRDGRFVFARFSVWGPSGHELGMKWWDAATGRQVGEAPDTADVAFLDNGRVLVTHAPEPMGTRRSGGNRESYLLRFRDIETGRDLGSWNLDSPGDKSGFIWDIAGSDSDRYLAAPFNPDYGVGRGVGGRLADRVGRLVGGPAMAERDQVLLLDVIGRRELARLPGKSCALSPNGRWLATLNETGLVRVWEAPSVWSVRTQTPWARLFAFAAGASTASAGLILLLTRLARRIWRSPVGDVVRSAWDDKFRRRCAVGVLLVLMAVCVAGFLYAGAAARVHEAMETAYEQVGDGMTEDDVAALVGRRADEGLVQPMTQRSKGGGRTDGPTTLRKWSRYGTEIDVYFGPDGKVRSSYISAPISTLERIAGWLGI
jgi:hypothetical protein